MSWYFTKEQLRKPVKERGTDYETAQKYRRATCDFLQKAGIELQLYVPLKEKSY